MKDYYKILGVDKKATDKEIKKSYRTLSKKHHPDKGGDEDKFKEISEAYATLSDKKKKQQYDMGGFNPHNPFSQQQRHKVGVHLQMKVSITLEEVMSGVSKTLKYKRQEHCLTCDGTGGKSKTCDVCNGSGVEISETRTPIGYIRQQHSCTKCGGDGEIITDPCKDCNGSGVTLKDTEVKFDIPPGIPDNTTLGYQEGGNYTRNGGAGDLILVIYYQEHDKFEVQGSDLIYYLKLTYPELIRGGKHSIPSISGTKLNFQIKELGSVDNIYKLKDKGLINQYKKKGRLIVVTKLKEIKEVTPELEEILKNMDKYLSD